MAVESRVYSYVNRKMRMGNPVQAMPLRQSEHGSCVEKKMQLLASGLCSAGVWKNSRMQFVSPCRSGDSLKAFTEAVTVSKLDCVSTAAPNGEPPVETNSFVFGMMLFCRLLTMAVSKADGLCGMADFVAMVLGQLGCWSMMAGYRYGCRKG